MSYWFVLLGKELYCYKNKGDEKHKEMRSLSGVFINNEIEETNDTGEVLHSFMLIFPNKRRIYFFTDLEEKMKWLDAIK